MKKCKFCEREFDTQGKLNLHQYHCMIKQHRKEQGENVSRGTKEVLDETQNCAHSFRLLNGSIPIEKRAIQNGFMEVCRKCQSVQ